MNGAPTATRTSALGRRFDLGLAARLILLIASATAFALAATRPGLHATTLLTGLLTLAAIAELWWFLRRTNIAVARFVESVAHGDFTQNFAATGTGAGFDELGASLNSAIHRLRANRDTLEDKARTRAALIDDVPTALISLDREGRVTLLNKTARRLLQQASGIQLTDLAAEHPRLAADLAAAPTGSRTRTSLSIGGAPTTALIALTEIHSGHEGPLRIAALQPIQQELDRAELTAQTDLVRVLTHEIMNSMTPVTSLSATAASLLAEADTGHDPALADARAAIETVARRSEGIMRFVQTYRVLTRPPSLARRQVALAPLFAELQRLFQADWPATTVTFHSQVTPPHLAADADPDLLAQLLLNLLRNAAEAATPATLAPSVTLEAHATKAGRLTIDVTDNGPGIPADQLQDIFLPFFTTKASGTGVGLSLARQIALAHNGSLACEPAEAGGTRFRLWL